MSRGSQRAIPIPVNPTLNLKMMRRTRSLTSLNRHASVVERKRIEAKKRKAKKEQEGKVSQAIQKVLHSSQTVPTVPTVLIPIPTLVRAVERMGPDSM